MPRVAESAGADDCLETDLKCASEYVMSQEIGMSHRTAFGNMKVPALQVQSTTLGTLAHSRHSQLQLTLGTYYVGSCSNGKEEMMNIERSTLVGVGSA